MKILVFVIVSFFIITKQGWNDTECGIRSAAQAVPPRIWSEQANDGNKQNTIITRFLHNKVGVYLQEFSICYFGRISPTFIYETAGFFGLILSLYALYLLFKNSQILLLTAIFLVTLIPTASINHPTSIIGVNMLAYFYKLLSISTLAIYLNKK